MNLSVHVVPNPKRLQVAKAKGEFPHKIAFGIVSHVQTTKGKPRLGLEAQVSISAHC